MLKDLRLLKEEDGIGIVWTAFFFMIMIGIAGLAIDGGRLYRTKSDLRKTANAAVLSGAQELKTYDSDVEMVVMNIIRANGAEDYLKPDAIEIRPEGQNKVSVTLEREVPLHFMKIFNFDSVPVSVKSSAAINPVKETSGAVPLGITEEEMAELSKVENRNKYFDLKVGAGGGEAGNYGVLTLVDKNGGGARVYLDNLVNGYPGDLKIGDTIETETGNMVGSTRKGINELIKQSQAKGYTEYDPENKDDPRLVKVLVYTVNEYNGNQIKSVTITGHALFYILEPMSHNDDTIKGMFVQGTIGAIGDENAPDYGSYAVKLVE